MFLIYRKEYRGIVPLKINNLNMQMQECKTENVRTQSFGDLCARTSSDRRMWSAGTSCGFNLQAELLENMIIKYHTEKRKEEDAMDEEVHRKEAAMYPMECG